MTDLSLERSSSNDEELPLYTMLNALSWGLFYDLSVDYETSRSVGNMQSEEPIGFCEEWNIHPYFNAPRFMWDSILLKYYLHSPKFYGLHSHLTLLLYFITRFCKRNLPTLQYARNYKIIRTYPRLMFQRFASTKLMTVLQKFGLQVE